MGDTAVSHFQLNKQLIASALPRDSFYSIDMVRGAFRKRGMLECSGPCLWTFP